MFFFPLKFRTNIQGKVRGTTLNNDSTVLFVGVKGDGNAAGGIYAFDALVHSWGSDDEEGGELFGKAINIATKVQHIHTHTHARARTDTLAPACIRSVEVYVDRDCMQASTDIDALVNLPVGGTTSVSEDVC